MEPDKRNCSKSRSKNPRGAWCKHKGSRRLETKLAEHSNRVSEEGLVGNFEKN